MCINFSLLYTGSDKFIRNEKQNSCMSLSTYVTKTFGIILWVTDLHVTTQICAQLLEIPSF